MARGCRLWVLVGVSALCISVFGYAAMAHEPNQTRSDSFSESAAFDVTKALTDSQQAVGRRLADYDFVTSKGELFRLSSAAGKPVIVNLVYTSCIDTCPLTVQALARAVDAAASAVQLDQFTVLTIGFDVHADTPQRMRDFARAQGIDHRNWQFLSADAATIGRLTADLGFLFAPIAGGFEHISQTTVLDREGRVYRHVYGADFSPQQLVEPLKQLVFGGTADAGVLAGLLDRVKLLCTVYDPNTGRYRFSYAIIIELIVGGLSLAAVGGFLARIWLQARHATAARRAP